MEEAFGSEKLVVWQKARVLVTETYRLTRTFPDVQRYGISSGMLRAAVSVTSDIAQGSARTTPPYHL